MLREGLKSDVRGPPGQREVQGAVHAQPLGRGMDLPQRCRYAHITWLIELFILIKWKYFHKINQILNSNRPIKILRKISKLEGKSMYQNSIFLRSVSTQTSLNLHKKKYLQRKLTTINFHAQAEINEAREK